MIPLKLTLKGIYSYIEEQTIDFEKLTESKLFGIFGSVGSGKSTILEAITFALYNDTERLNNRDSRNYNMMNLKSNELLIDFEFYTESSDEKYRFIVKSKRNRNKFEDVSIKERSILISKNNGEWIPTEKTAEEIIGLSYTNFKRTIIIPQGKFKEFLELGAKDRTEMLNEIFNLQKFDLASKLGSIKKENDDAIILLEGEMIQYENKNDDELNNLKSEKDAVNTLEESETKIVNSLRDSIQSQNKLKDLFGNIDKVKSRLKGFSELKEGFDKRKTRLDNYSFCRINFAELLNSEFRLKKEIKDTSGKHAEVKELLDSLSNNKSAFERKLEDLKKVYDNREIIKDEAKELSLIVETKALIKEEKALAERVQRGDQFVKSQKEQLSELKGNLNSKKVSILNLKEGVSNISELHNVKGFHVKSKILSAEVGEFTKEIASVNTDKNNIKNKVKSNINEKYIGETISETKLNILTDIDLLKDNKIALNDEINHLTTQEKLKQWADDLEEGIACPVCGSNNHPNILNIKDLKVEVDSIRGKEKVLDLEVSTLEKQFSQLGIYESQITGLDKTITTTTLKLNNRKTEIDTHNNSFVWSKYEGKSLEIVETLISETESLNNTILNLEKEVVNEESEISKSQNKIDDYSKAIQQFSNEQISKKTAIELNTSSLKFYKLEEFENDGDESISNKAIEKNTLLERVISEFEKFNKELNLIGNLISENNGQEKQLSEQLANDELELKITEKNIKALLAESEYETLQIVKNILSDKINEQGETNAINDFYNSFKNANEELERLNAESSNKVFDKDKMDQDIVKLSSKEEELNILTSRKGVLISEVKNLESDLKKKKDLEKKNENLLKRKENISLLYNLFKAKGFVNYISTVYLQNLSQSANDRFFKMTKQHLQLEITDANEFQIRDYLNEGKTRSVKTLSGGQMFQASLSLALALADSVQNQIKANNNFFFLDEGFGSLDDEALHIVFETLKSLKNENRIVGVISHVESLKQEIDVHLQVNKNEERGSLVNYSWE